MDTKVDGEAKQTHINKGKSKAQPTLSQATCKANYNAINPTLLLTKKRKPPCSKLEQFAPSRRRANAERLRDQEHKTKNGQHPLKRAVLISAPRN